MSHRLWVGRRKSVVSLRSDDWHGRQQKHRGTHQRYATCTDDTLLVVHLVVRLSILETSLAL